MKTQKTAQKAEETENNCIRPMKTGIENKQN